MDASRSKFPKELYTRIFYRQPYREFINDYIRAIRSGEYDNRLIYRKRLRRKLSDYQRNVPPHVRAARQADEYNLKLQRPLQYQNGVGSATLLPKRVLNRLKP